MHPSSSRGQASAEYVGVVCVIALVVAAAVAAAAAMNPALGTSVVAQLERALCVVGMDVCDTARAKAMGLEPCVTASDDRTRGTGILITVVKTGGNDRLVVEKLSDGTYRITASRGTSLDAAAGIGFDAGPIAVGADVSAGGRFTSGTQVDLPDAAALRAMLGGAVNDPSKARRIVREIEDRLPASRVTRYREGGAGAAASASAAIGDEGLEGSAAPRAAIGRRIRNGVTTWYYEVASTLGGPLTELLPNEGGRLTAAWQASDPPVLVASSSQRRGGREAVIESRIVLRTPEARAEARRWLLSPGAIGDGAGRALARRIGADGVTQRLVYDESTLDEGSRSVSGRLGVGLGYDHDASVTRRHLVDAQVLSSPVGGRREDCLSG